MWSKDLITEPASSPCEFGRSQPASSLWSAVDTLEIVEIAPDADILARMLAYWNHARAGHRFPNRCQLDPATMPADVLPYIHLLDVLERPRDYRYRLMGTGIASRSRRDYTGERVSAIRHQRPPSRFWAQLEKTVDEARPVCIDLPYEGPDEAVRRVENLMMPLGPADAGVTMLLGVVNFEVADPFNLDRLGPPTP